MVAGIHGGSSGDGITQIVLNILEIIIGGSLTLAIFVGILFLMISPLRKRNRARAFLDALQLGIESGQTPEETVRAIQESGEHKLGSAFEEFAQHVTRGQDVVTALRATPAFLQPQVRGMLESAFKTDNLAAGLELARQTVTPGVSRSRATMNYGILFVFYGVHLLTILGIVSGLQVFILPKFAAIFEDLGIGATVAPMPFGLMIGATAAVWGLACAFFLWADSSLMLPSTSKLISRVRLRLAPWRRKRCRYRFSLVLGRMLEAGCGETEAVRNAAEATGESAYMILCSKADKALADGMTLPDVLTRYFDPSGELAWRMESFGAQQDYTGLTSSLEAWGRYLDAAAFKNEQMAAQITSTVLLLLMAGVVALAVVTFFTPLIKMIESFTIW